MDRCLSIDKKKMKKDIISIIARLCAEFKSYTDSTINEPSPFILFLLSKRIHHFLVDNLDYMSIFLTKLNSTRSSQTPSKHSSSSSE